MKTKSKNQLFSVLILLSCILPLKSYAQENDKAIKSKLNEATVFLRGTELTHTASTSLSNGYNEIKIRDLSPNIDKNSLKIKASNGVMISSFEFSVDQIPTKKPNNLKI